MPIHPQLLCLIPPHPSQTQSDLMRNKLLRKFGISPSFSFMLLHQHNAGPRATMFQSEHHKYLAVCSLANIYNEHFMIIIYDFVICSKTSRPWQWEVSARNEEESLHHPIFCSHSLLGFCNYNGIFGIYKTNWCCARMWGWELNIGGRKSLK